MSKQESADDQGPPSKKMRFYDVASKVLEVMRIEKNSEAHMILREYVDNEHAAKDPNAVPGVVHPGATGVIYCTDRAMANGFTYDSPEWGNMGQGAPEVGPLPGAPDRPKVLDFEEMGEWVNEYAPTAGIKPLREAVAKLYNETYRQGMKSQYTYENVCIVPGGRAGMSRVAAVIGDVYCGYQIPEYTTYSEVLAVFKRLIPIPTPLKAENDYRLDIDKLIEDIRTFSLSVVVMSNPRNPTGSCIEGEDLKKLVRIGDGQTTVILDEFYSFYKYWEDKSREGESLSGAAYVDDVNKDSVIIIDGLTKGFRLPGWRVCWVVGPKSLISAVASSGSFLDGGTNHPLQMAAIPLLEPSRVKLERLAVQKHFRKKRDYVLKRLEEMGLKTHTPEATFYIWVDLSSLQPPLDDGLVFFEELLKEKAICVPGIAFDIDPAARRNLFESPAHHFVRLSYGPKMENLRIGMDAIERVLKKQKEVGTVLGEGYAKSKSSKHPGVHHDHYG